MTHTYKVTGMTCGKCLQTVKITLEKISGIEKADVTLEPPQAVINMKHHIPVVVMNKALAKSGKYSLVESDDLHNEMGVANTDPTAETAVKTATFFKTYKPILLVFAYLLGVALLSGFTMESFNVMISMNVFMGGFFFVFSFFKLLDLKGFAYSYVSYDIIAKKWIGWGFIYPFIELTLGLAYLFHFNSTITNIVTVVVMGVSSVGVIQSLLAKKKFQCACLGTVFNLPMSNITLIEDLLMVAMAAIMLLI